MISYQNDRNQPYIRSLLFLFLEVLASHTVVFRGVILGDKI